MSAGSPREPFPAEIARESASRIRPAPLESAHQMPLQPGSRLGPYEILAAIGAGGMGEVYRARDPRLGREVAIKVLPASFSADDDRLRRFEQEARAAGILNHPNITAVHDIGTNESDGSPYVVQELLEGETLRAVLCGRPALAAPRDRLLAPDRPRPRRRAREGDRPPGPEAREHLRHERRPGEDPGLRPREADARRRAGPGHATSRPQPRHRARRHPRDARLHVARAGPGQARRRALRHLLLRRDPLRDARGPPRLPRRLRGRHDVGDPEGGPAGSLRHQPERPARARPHRPPLPREEPRPALPLRARSRVRSRGPLGRRERSDRDCSRPPQRARRGSSPPASWRCSLSFPRASSSGSPRTPRRSPRSSS